MASPSVIITKPTKDAKLGIGLGPSDDGTIRVTSIAEDGLFSGTDLEVGMKLDTINGEQYSTYNEGVSMLKEAEGRVTITVSDAYCNRSNGPPVDSNTTMYPSPSVVLFTKPTKDTKLGIGLGPTKSGRIKVTSIDKDGLFEGTDLEVGMEIGTINGEQYSAYNEGVSMLKEAEGQVAIEVSWNFLSVLDEDRIPDEARVAGGLVGMVLFIVGLLSGFVNILIIGLACLVGAIAGKRGDVESVKRSEEDICPKCGAKGTIEVYNLVTSELHRGFLSRTRVTTKTPTVNCMKTQCSYRQTLRLHTKDKRQRERTKAFIDTLHREATTTSMSSENALLPEESASIMADALEEEEDRRELRQKKSFYGNRNWSTHPDSGRLQEEFGSCPECGNGIEFARFVRAHQPHGVLWTSVVQENLSVAECCSENCGYISKLDRHKERIQQGDFRANEMCMNIV